MIGRFKKKDKRKKNKDKIGRERIEILPAWRQTGNYGLMEDWMFGRLDDSR